MENKKIWQAVGILLTIIAFLILAVVAAVEFSGDELGSERVRQGFVYQAGALALKSGENFFSALTGPWRLASQKEETENKTGARGLAAYIKLEKQNSAWQLTLQNSRGIIWQKSWPRLFGR